MIVRLNQLEPNRLEQEAGWASAGLLGPIVAAPPAEARGFELLILGQDEQNRPVSEAFRQAQLRQMIPHAVAALREADEVAVVRLDGPVAEGELLPAFRWLTDPDGRGRFAVTGVQKLEERPMETLASVRIQPSPTRLTGLCVDTTLGLERSVRLRAFCVPESLVNPLLEIPGTDDERWATIYGRAGLVLSATRGLRSLQLTCRRLDAAAVKGRIMQRLVSVASGVGQPLPA